MPFDEVKCFGCKKEDFLASVRNSITFKIEPDPKVGAAKIAASLMSDAQEQIAHGDGEGARQTLNRAKLVLFELGTR